MQISTRFTVGVHTMLCIAYFTDEKVTSNFIASSVNVNPVVVRRTLGMLKSAGLVKVEPGVGGARLARRPEDITLLDVFDAVDAVEGSLFSFHEHPNENCPVGSRVHELLDSRLDAAQRVMRDSLAQTTLAELLAEMNA